MSALFDALGYRVTPRVQRGLAYDDAVIALDAPTGDPSTLVRKAVACAEGWTVLVDPELVLIDESRVRSEGFSPRLEDFSPPLPLR